MLQWRAQSRYYFPRGCRLHRSAASARARIGMCLSSPRQPIKLARSSARAGFRSIVSVRFNRTLLSAENFGRLSGFVLNIRLSRILFATGFAPTPPDLVRLSAFGAAQLYATLVQIDAAGF